MKTWRLLFASFLFVCATSTFAQDDAKASLKDRNPEPVVGEQIAMTAMLPTPKSRDFFNPLDEVDETKLEKVNFLFFLPSDESAKTENGFPLLLFLHGIGERGDNVDVLKNFGPARICNNSERAKGWKFLTVSPQCPNGHFWSAKQLRFLLDQLCESYPIDRSRIYITGLSMGGFGVWSMLGSYPEIIAAAAPICGGGAPQFAEKMKDVPIWAFHGEDDPLVKVELSRIMIKAIKDAGGKDAHITTYPGVGHNSWDRAYAEPELYDWLLSKQLGVSTPSVPKAANADDGEEDDASGEVKPGATASRFAMLPLFKRNEDGSETQVDSQTQKIGYLFFLPENESEKTEAGFPLMLFLHGSGERGTNLNVLKQYGPPRILESKDRAKTWPFVTVMPQCPARTSWSVEQMKLLVEEIAKEFPVDPDRIYVTGVSMGGRGTWMMMKLHPEFIAAAAPICGWGDLDAASKMVDVPVWAFHGENDPAVNCQRSIEMIDALRKAGNQDAHITTYPGVGHNSWLNAYADEELYKWLLQKKRGENNPTTPKTANPE